MLPRLSFTKIQIVFFIFFLGILGLTVFIARQQSDNRTRAAGFSVQEAESGLIIGNVRKESDPQASGGQFIRFGAQ